IAQPEWPAWHPHGELLAVASGTRISLWNATTGTLERELPGRMGALVDNLVFNHAGDLLASTTWGGQLALWDSYSGERLLLMENVDYRNWAPRLQFSADDRLLGYGTRQPKVQLWQLARAKECRQLFPTGAWDAAFHPTGRVVASSDNNGVRLWDLEYAK